ncbi:MAG: UDP-N-acetylmuramoyl-L-alanine--D-glutamate ligase [Actinomycetota bacterium]
MTRALVYGLAIAGEATARALLDRGVDVIAVDDRVDVERSAAADRLNIELIEAPDDAALTTLINECDLVVPAPGVPEHHRVFAATAKSDAEVVSEIELAYRWEAERAGGARPMLAVTGTDGKTTTTLLAVEMLRAGGVRTVDAGNTETPLVAALELDVDAFVVECTSFRLAWTSQFRADAGAWLNLAPDHLDWHRSFDTYRSAKARLWAAQRSDDVAIGFADDPVVMAELAHAVARRRTFSVTSDEADYFCDRTDEPGGVLTGPSGPLVACARVARNRPHDLSNTLAAAALVLEPGLVDAAAVADAASRFVGPPHRLELLGTWEGVAWYNDSKATTPHAAAAAIHAFEHIVLIAGGYDKGVDLGAMAAAPAHVDAVIAIGDTAERVLDAFADVEVCERAGDLGEAVDRAARLATAGSTVLLSPGCASFDAYRGFEARGDHFRRLVLDMHNESPAGDAHDTRNRDTTAHDTPAQDPPDRDTTMNGAPR